MLDTNLLEHTQDTSAELAHLQTSVTNTQSSLVTLTQQMTSQLSFLTTTLSEHKQETTAELTQLQTSTINTQSSLVIHTQQVNTKLSLLTTSLSQHKQQTAAELAQLQTSLTNTNSKLEALDTSLSEHKLGTLAELAQLQTSLTATQSSLAGTQSSLTSTQSSVEAANSKLDTIVTTTTRLTTGHEELQAGISELESVGTGELHQYLWNNLTHQLDAILSHVSRVQGPYTCGGTTGWRRVVYLDMTDPSTTCPSGWRLTGYSKRTCGRVSDGWRTCDSVTFPVSGGEYSRVCGRIKAYQWGGTLAFSFYNPVTSIDGAYITGFSLTHGDTREHIWTFAAGISEQQYLTGVSNCPCSSDNFHFFEYWNSRVPSFIGNDYFCESGLNSVWGDGSHGYRIFPDDPLWDGENCPTGTCCSFSNPPFFFKTLDSSTSDDLELRLCNSHTSTYSNVPVELIELYVQ